MNTVVVGLAGLCLGALVARASVPRLQLLPLACSLILAVVGVVPLLLASPESLLNGLLCVFTVVVAASLYGAELWRRTVLGAEFSRWQLVWMGAWLPGYLRAAYEASERGTFTQPAQVSTRK